MPDWHFLATLGAQALTGGDDDPLYDHLRSTADGELLVPWCAHLPAFDSEPVARLVSAGLILTYRAGKPRRPYCYVAGMYQPGDQAGPGSDWPPPSIQAGETWTMYAARDQNTCHLCGHAVVIDWRSPKESRSLDHLIPRSKGGTNYPSNIRLAHISCNKGRRTRDVSEFREWLATHQRRHDRFTWIA